MKSNYLFLAVLLYFSPLLQRLLPSPLGEGLGVRSGEAAAQTPQTFSADSVKFLSEMDDWFSSVKGKEKEGHSFIKEQFKPFWFGGYMTDDKRQFVYSLWRRKIIL